jgi:hypothetical protein
VSRRIAGPNGVEILLHQRECDARAASQLVGEQQGGCDKFGV